MPYRVLYFILLLMLMIFYPLEAQARPINQTINIFVRVCYDDSSCAVPTNINSNLVNLDHYTEQVLANEWHAAAELDALKAGAVAIRTFAYRKSGCGAFLRSNVEPAPFFGSRLVNNRSQRYRLGDHITSPQNPVTADHSQAQSETRSAFLYRADGSDFACAKYDANTGDPTRACSSAECPDDRDQVTLPGVPDPVSNRVGSRISIGMSQNGSAAWVEGLAPWDWRQALSHYYDEVLIANSHPEYRWVWLDNNFAKSETSPKLLPG